MTAKFGPSSSQRMSTCLEIRDRSCGKVLVDRIECDRPGDSRMNVYVQLGVAGESEQQFLNLDSIHHHAVSLGSLRRLGLGQDSLEICMGAGTVPEGAGSPARRCVSDC